MIKTKSCAKKHRTRKQQSGGAKAPVNNNADLKLAMQQSINNEIERQRKQKLEETQLATVMKKSQTNENARIARKLQEQKNINAATRQSQSNANEQMARALQENANLQEALRQSLLQPTKNPEPHRGAAAARTHNNKTRIKTTKNNNNTRIRHTKYNNNMRKKLNANNNNPLLNTITNIANYNASILQKQSECEDTKQIMPTILETTNISVRYVPKQYNYIWASNSCYLHSALQLFKNIPELIDTINSPNINSPVLNLCSHELERHGLPTSNSSNLIEIVMQSIDFVPGQTQHWGESYDTIEFIQNILGKLHISELLYMTFLYKTYTFNMDNTSTIRSISSQQSYLLVLDLHSKSYNNIQDILSQQINAIENINSQFLKTTNYKITDTTQYILIQLVIFEFNGDEFIKKNLHITNLNDVLCIDGILFELISMIVHIGNFAGGHYINYSKQYDPSTKTCNWYKYDDNIHPDSDYDTRHIKPTPSPEAPVFLGPLLDLPSKKDLIPYVLLYKKIS